MACYAIKTYVKLYIRVEYRYSDKTDHGQNGPDKTDHLSGQNGPRLRTKRTTFQDKTDQASGQKGPRF